ncbi:uncharacterized protein LOC111022043 isoform X2 [Momordica charantia]|uniref:Uncharacterized protein LOC111022043 isoform X2 n=1 Tax=Momordica charantia TaxID=3673 RepID=A0A6J1DLJ5_MOMCH|nr:uncharacterized protein LOC111022043 isoform X2 [Momordica charantia]
MGYSWFLKSPKEEEQEVPNGAVKGDFEAFLEDKLPPPPPEAEDNFLAYGGPPDWGLNFDYEYFPVPVLSQTNIVGANEEAAAAAAFGRVSDDGDGRKKEEEEISLKLNLNYEEVLEAWSGRGSLWAAADDSSLSNLTNAAYMGEVPRIEEERRRRVLRYKEKRHNRLFSNKIRYQGRFVKTVS